MARAAVYSREGSAKSRLLAVLARRPAVSIDDVEELTGASAAAAYGALSVLTEAGVLRVAVQRKRDRVWVAADVMDEVEEMLARLAAPTR